MWTGIIWKRLNERPPITLPFPSELCRGDTNKNVRTVANKVEIKIEEKQSVNLKNQTLLTSHVMEIILKIT